METGQFYQYNERFNGRVCWKSPNVWLIFLGWCDIKIEYDSWAFGWLHYYGKMSSHNTIFLGRRKYNNFLTREGPKYLHMASNYSPASNLRKISKFAPVNILWEVWWPVFMKNPPELGKCLNEVILLAQFIYISCSQYLQFWVPNLFDIGHLFSREICG